MRVMRIGFALLIACSSGAASAGLQFATPNALLVVDGNNDRVLRVPLAGGAVTVFSPPAGAQINLLDAPRGIGVGPDGTIVVANFFTGKLIELDPATGAQFPVAAPLSSPPAIGSLPRDVAVNPRPPALGFFPTLGVASQGELHQVVRSAFAATGSLLAPYPSPYDPYAAAFVVPVLPGNDDPLDYVVATTSIPALLWYDGALDAFTPIWEDEAVDVIQGLDAPRDGPYALVASFLVAACPSFSNGIRFFTQLAETGSLVYPDTCPGPIAYDGANNILFVVALDTVPLQVIRVTGFGVFPVASIAGTLPGGTSASDMALANVPESGSGLCALTAMLMLFMLERTSARALANAARARADRATARTNPRSA